MEAVPHWSIQITLAKTMQHSSISLGKDPISKVTLELWRKENEILTMNLLSPERNACFIYRASQTGMEPVTLPNKHTFAVYTHDDAALSSFTTTAPPRFTS